MTIKNVQNKLNLYNDKHSDTDVGIMLLSITSRVVCVLLIDFNHPNDWYCTRLSSYPQRSYSHKGKNIPKRIKDIWDKFCFVPPKQWGIEYSYKKGWTIK